MKVRTDGELACEVHIYANDGQICGHSEITCWEAAKRFCSMCVSLGIQDVSQKRTGPSLYPGPWAGTVLDIGMGVVATVTIEKWQKTKELILELSTLLREGKLPQKRLERIHGFLIYVSRTFRWMTPYLKGLHLTIDG